MHKSTAVDFDKQKYRIQSHPLFSHVQRALFDIDERANCVPADPAVWANFPDSKEPWFDDLTKFLLNYLRLLQLESGKRERLNSITKRVCSIVLSQTIPLSSLGQENSDAALKISSQDGFIVPQRTIASSSSVTALSSTSSSLAATSSSACAAVTSAGTRSLSPSFSVSARATAVAAFSGSFATAADRRLLSPLPSPEFRDASVSTEVASHSSSAIKAEGEVDPNRCLSFQQVFSKVSAQEDQLGTIDSTRSPVAAPSELSSQESPLSSSVLHSACPSFSSSTATASSSSIDVPNSGCAPSAAPGVSVPPSAVPPASPLDIPPPAAAATPPSSTMQLDTPAVNSASMVD